MDYNQDPEKTRADFQKLPISSSIVSENEGVRDVSVSSSGASCRSSGSVDYFLNFHADRLNPVRS